ncbi:DNA-binding transcriptional regulator, MarR family [Thermomonospora echinospora]|uniref:DNA-binding transcriptional regulator, MarR family n=1 Tax=Thermomonospora echinospora TaxID=1992 RepID=A0A1H5W2Y9_9ACTN|nr:MarR family transcriptional regulator [Thermomonospora echinospora]SEF93862.1 DNA-binding transcriptional regulator, MarR family [Thermomonospora echinospora]
MEVAGKRVLDVPDRAELIEGLRLAMQRSTMWTVLLHHATASRAGINMTDAQCINLLVLDGPQTPGRLAQTMGITTGGAITAVIDRLERAGYVKRTRDPQDRRRVIVEPVPETVARLSSYFEPVARAAGDRLAALDDEQLQVLADWFQNWNAMMPAVIEDIQHLP